jgi:hypothetical protein
MASYSTKLTLPDVLLGKSEAEFFISHDKSPIGRIRISKGSIDWFEGKARTGKSLTWKEFAKLMETANGRKVMK